MINSQIILFCESNFLDSTFLVNLRQELKKDGFLLKNIKNKVFKNQLKDSILKESINGSIFIIYKDKIESENDFKVLQKFANYNFVLCCLFNNKLYSSLILDNFKNISFIHLYSKVYSKINFSALGRLHSVLKQISV